MVQCALRGLLHPATHSLSSCPRLSRASTSFASARKDVDGRAKPGHDGGMLKILRQVLPPPCAPAGRGGPASAGGDPEKLLWPGPGGGGGDCPPICAGRLGVVV